MSDPTEYWVVVNSLGKATVVSSPGRVHVTLWRSRAEAEDHAEQMRKINPGKYDESGTWVDNPYIVRRATLRWEKEERT